MIIYDYVIPFIITVAAESAVALAFNIWLKLRLKYLIIGIFAINLMTNPTLNYILDLTVFIGIGIIIPLIVLEIVVVLIEWWALKYMFGNRQALLLLSLSANALSFLAGLIVFSFILRLP